MAISVSGDIHGLVARNALAEVQRLLRAPEIRQAVDRRDGDGRTPLMHAVHRREVDIAMVRLLLDAGADPNARAGGESGHSVLSLALHGGDRRKVGLLLERGADLGYRREGGYEALVDAVYGRDIDDDPELLELLTLLIENGARLNGITEWGESALKETSRVGRFDAVKVLLAAGADEGRLQWSRLLRAVAVGTTAEVQSELDAGADLEVRDAWQRTPWLLAIQTGSIEKAKRLLEHGADRDARGWCDLPPLSYAIGARRRAVLRWLLGVGLEVDATDEFGTTALIEAAERGDDEGVRLLLQHGAAVDHDANGTALNHTSSPGVAHTLLDAGADPANLSFEARRRLVGFEAAPTDEYLAVSTPEFLQGRYRRFGRANPEEIHEPFWEAMVRSGVNAWRGAQPYEGRVPQADQAVFSAERFGQSITFLPDGRVVQIGGEHEDHYDRDFCIYNDVFIHGPDGSLRICAYPEELFPPTDFHTATLVDEWIYIVGSLGYAGRRRFGETPVFRLSVRDFHIERMMTHGDAPGWIHGHMATRAGDGICVTGGRCLVLEQGRERLLAEGVNHLLDLATRRWTLC